MPRGAELTRVTIVEDHELFAEALELAITLQGHAVQRVSAPAYAESVASLLRAILRQRPEVVLLDLDLGSTDGSHLVASLTSEGVAVVVLSGTEDAGRLGHCLALGARAVLRKSSDLNSIVSAIRRVATGQPAMDPAERERLLSGYTLEHRRTQETRAALATLSPREAEILGELMNGRPVPDIARASFVSEATVRTQVKAIRSKLGVSSQIAAVGAARRAHWHPPRTR